MYRIKGGMLNGNEFVKFYDENLPKLIAFGCYYMHEIELYSG